nr:nif-specific transcriptional activator NifA [Gammaproteobacteria bacterium]
MFAQSDRRRPYPGRQGWMETQLRTLYRVSEVLSRSGDLRETLMGVLAVLHGEAGLQRGIVAIRTRESAELAISAAYAADQRIAASVRYGPGEGVLGAVIARGERIVVKRIADEPRFLDRLRVYDPALPLIAVPVRFGEGEPIGVLAVQPAIHDDEALEACSRFLEMTANLIAGSVRLTWKVEADRRDIADERDRLRRFIRGQYGFDNMVGHTSAMQRVFELVRQVGKWTTTVLVRGESGTGKELIANAIHYNSPRASGPLIKLNCAALPDNLLESELFGHEKGAFTGASYQRKGRFEQADGGTLFLDEIGELSPAFQAKLLRVLQEGEFERVGGIRTLRVDVRVIAATNRNLETAVENGEFREDLYYRLNVMPIYVPPLRERQQDIPELARHLVTKLGKCQGRGLRITDSAIRALLGYSWPGNVRELENTLERAAVMSEQGVIDSDVIELAGAAGDRGLFGAGDGPLPDMNLEDPDLDERERVIAALERAGWVQAKAARLLGMTPRQIAYRIQTLNIKMRHL